MSDTKFPPLGDEPKGKWNPSGRHAAEEVGWGGQRVISESELEADRLRTSYAAAATRDGGPIRPGHYQKHPSGVECITIVQEFNFNIGNVIKYCWRAGEKPGEKAITDLQKAQQYIAFEIARLEASLKRR